MTPEEFKHLTDLHDNMKVFEKMVKPEFINTIKDYYYNGEPENPHKSDAEQKSIELCRKLDNYGIISLNWTKDKFSIYPTKVSEEVKKEIMESIKQDGDLIRSWGIQHIGLNMSENSKKEFTIVKSTINSTKQSEYDIKSVYVSYSQKDEYKIWNVGIDTDAKQSKNSIADYIYDLMEKGEKVIDIDKLGSVELKQFMHAFETYYWYSNFLVYLIAEIYWGDLEVFDEYEIVRKDLVLDGYYDENGNWIPKSGKNPEAEKAQD